MAKAFHDDDLGACEICGVQYYGKHLCHGSRKQREGALPSVVQYIHLPTEGTIINLGYGYRLADGFDMLRDGGWDKSY